MRWHAWHSMSIAWHGIAGRWDHLAASGGVGTIFSAPLPGAWRMCGARVSFHDGARRLRALLARHGVSLGAACRSVVHTTVPTIWRGCAVGRAPRWGGGGGACGGLEGGLGLRLPRLPGLPLRSALPFPVRFPAGLAIRFRGDSAEVLVSRGCGAVSGRRTGRDRGVARLSSICRVMTVLAVMAWSRPSHIGLDTTAALLRAITLPAA
jgi:hypothetical protein